MIEGKCDGCGQRPDVYGSRWCANCQHAIPEYCKRRIIEMESALRELTHTNRHGQLISIKADVSDMVGPLIGWTRPEVRTA